MSEGIITLAVGAAIVGAIIYFHHDQTPEERRQAMVDEIVERQKTLRHVVVSPEGCIVYRFEDRARDHYFANCAGSVSDSYDDHHGKITTQHDEEIATGI